MEVVVTAMSEPPEDLTVRLERVVRADLRPRRSNNPTHRWPAGSSESRGVGMVPPYAPKLPQPTLSTRMKTTLGFFSCIGELVGFMTGNPAGSLVPRRFDRRVHLLHLGLLGGRQLLVLETDLHALIQTHALISGPAPSAR